jgi:hypothetical protein
MVKSAGETSSNSAKFFFWCLSTSNSRTLLSHYYRSNRYKEKVKDYNFGSLIRTDAGEEYGEANTIFGKPPHFIHHRPRSHVDLNEIPLLTSWHFD